MADPVDLLIAQIDAALDDAGLKVSVLDGPVDNLKPPAVVIRPDSPWIVPSKFCYDQQRYQAVMVVTASTPGDGRRMLYRISRAIRNAFEQDDGWSWESVSSPIVDQSTGSPYLAAGVRLIYSNTIEEEEES